jgi:hypothetical protein
MIYWVVISYVGQPAIEIPEEMQKSCRIKIHGGQLCQLPRGSQLDIEIPLWS